MISISTKIVENGIALYSKEVKELIKNAEDGIDKLWLNRKKFNLTKKQVEYLNKISGRVEEFVKAKPSTLIKLENTFMRLPTEVKGVKIKFKDRVLNALGYSDLRSNFFPNYFQTIGIKSCVYCNSQLAICVEKYNSKMEAKFQLDHYIPKSKFPFLSISLYNLYPVCASCNLNKKEERVAFKLYKKTPTNISKFSFSLKNGIVAKYLLPIKLQQIEIIYSEPKVKKGEKTFEKTFSIQGIYNTQKDIAEELILKAKVYKKSYKKTLIKSFPKIFTDIHLTNRLIIGNYSREGEIHKRPMAKFTQDIAKQLKLI